MKNPNTPIELSEEKRNSIASEIKDRLNDYIEAARRQDTEWFRDFWLKGNDFAFSFDAEFITDYDPWFTKYYAEALPNVKEILHFKFGEGRVAVISDNAASYSTTFDWSMVTTKNDTIQSKGSAIYVLVRQDGKWKCVQSGGTHKYY